MVHIRKMDKSDCHNLAALAIQVWLTTWSHNHPAISFYKNFGLTSIGSTMFDLDGEQHENIVLALKE